MNHPPNGGSEQLPSMIGCVRTQTMIIHSVIRATAAMELCARAQVSALDMQELLWLYVIRLESTASRLVELKVEKHTAGMQYGMETHING